MLKSRLLYCLVPTQNNTPNIYLNFTGVMKSKNMRFVEKYVAQLSIRQTMHEILFYTAAIRVIVHTNYCTAPITKSFHQSTSKFQINVKLLQQKLAQPRTSQKDPSHIEKFPKTSIRLSLRASHKTEFSLNGLLECSTYQHPPTLCKTAQ